MFVADYFVVSLKLINEASCRMVTIAWGNGSVNLRLSRNCKLENPKPDSKSQKTHHKICCIFFIYEVWMMSNQKMISNMTIKMATIAIGSTLVMSPALAHHPLGGKMVSNPLEGLLSGIAHPVIGLDHLAFVIAVGCGSALLAQRQPIARFIPIGFLTAAIAGTAIHLLKVDLPFNELWVALSVLLLGTAIGLGQKLPVVALTGFVTLAGLFHGYAYGEAIVGAEMTQLVSYLVGFTAIQALIAYGTFFAVSKLQENKAQAIGWVAIGIGLSATLKAVGI